MTGKYIYHVTPNDRGEWSVQKELIRFDNQQEAIDFGRLLVKLEASGTLKVDRTVCKPELERTHIQPANN